jgi:hypothetical protein
MKIYSSSLLVLFSPSKNIIPPPPTTPVYALDANTIYVLDDGSPIEVF